MEHAVLAENELWGYSTTTRIQLFVKKSLSPNKHSTSPDICFLFLFFPLSFYPNFLPPVGHQRQPNEESPCWLSVLWMWREQLVLLLSGMGEESPRTLKALFRWKAAVWSSLRWLISSLTSHEELFLWRQCLRPTMVNCITKGKSCLRQGRNLPRLQHTQQDRSLPHPIHTLLQDVFTFKEIHFYADRLRSKFSSDQGSTCVPHWEATAGTGGRGRGSVTRHVKPWCRGRERLLSATHLSLL